LAWSTLYREVDRFLLGPLSWERGPVLTIVQAVLIPFLRVPSTLYDFPHNLIFIRCQKWPKVLRK
jgi:hypothetical protein